MEDARPEKGEPLGHGDSAPRAEIDHIRFEHEPLADGLWRHHPVRFVIEVARQRARQPRRPAASRNGDQR